MRIGFLGYGEAAAAFRETLAGAAPGTAWVAWDIKLANGAAAPAMRARIEGDGVAVLPGPEGFGEADWIVSAVTADQSLVALRALAPHLRQGQLVIDINSVSPDRKRVSAELIAWAGGRYLDMAVMAPVHPRGHRTPVLVAGETAEALVPELEALGFKLTLIGPEPGSATAIKMVRSLFVKGLEVLTVEALIAAEASGCFEAILESLSGSYPGLGWPEIASQRSAGREKVGAPSQVTKRVAPGTTRGRP